MTNEYMKKQFGKKLKEIRKANKCDQKTLAAAVGINSVTISQIERGKKFISGTTLFSICDYFNISASVLFDFESNINEDPLYKEIIDEIKKHPDKFNEIHRVVKALVNA